MGFIIIVSAPFGRRFGFTFSKHRTSKSKDMLGTSSKHDFWIFGWFLKHHPGFFFVGRKKTKANLDFWAALKRGHERLVNHK